jgi:hypothetical protein
MKEEDIDIKNEDEDHRAIVIDEEKDYSIGYDIRIEAISVKCRMRVFDILINGGEYIIELYMNKDEIAEILLYDDMYKIGTKLKRGKDDRGYNSEENIVLE